MEKDYETILPRAVIGSSNGGLQIYTGVLGKNLYTGLRKMTHDNQNILKVVGITAYSLLVYMLQGYTKSICKVKKGENLQKFLVAIDLEQNCEDTVRMLLNQVLQQWKRKETEKEEEKDELITVLLFGDEILSDYKRESLSIGFQNEEIIWCYDEAVFSKSLISYYHELFKRVLWTIVSEPDRKITDCEIYSKEEQKNIYDHWQGSSYPVNDEDSIITLFEQVVKKHPNHTAIYVQEYQITYQQLYDASMRMYLELLRKGVREQDNVAVYCTHSPFTIAAVLAIARIGGIYVPIDYQTPEEKIKNTIDEYQVSAFLVQAGNGIVRSKNIPNQVKLEWSSQKMLEKELAELEKLEKEQGTQEYSIRHTGYLILTSGTTGTPKGITICEDKLLNLCYWYRDAFSIHGTSRVILLNNFNFDASIKNIYTPLITGASIVLTTKGLFHTYEILEDIQRFEVTHLNCVPSLLYAILDTARHERFLHLSSINYAILGGEAIEPNKLHLWAKSENCHCKFANVYGPAECTSVSTFFVMEKEYVLANAVIPIGNPIYNKRVYVLNEKKKPMPPEAMGQIYIAGLGVIQGYTNLTGNEQKFVPSPIVQGEILYATGDLGAWQSDGTVIYKGRNDNQLKVNGQRVEAEELENTICQFEGIRSCIVSLYQGRNDTKRLVLYYELEDKTDFQQKKLIVFLKEHFPVSLIPQQFIQLDRIPVTPNGKKDRKHLPVPEETEKAENVQASSQLEALIAESWKKTLGMDSISIKVNFFEAGGTSLLLYRLKAEIDSRVGCNLELVELLNYTTIEQQAKWLANDGNLPQKDMEAEKKINDKRKNRAANRRKLGKALYEKI